MLPLEYRNLIAREWESIKRAYKTEENRQTALDMVIARIRQKVPEYFAEEVIEVHTEATNGNV